jgi:MFS family permease
VKIKNEKFIFRGYYFFFVMSSGVVLPYLNLYFKKIGLNGKQIGALSSLGMICMFFAPPLWSMINDTRNKRGRLIGFLIIACTLCFFSVSFSTAFYYLIPIIVAFYFFYSPLLPLSDAITLEYVNQAKNENFGKIRLWGTIGYMIASITIGWFINIDYIELPLELRNEILILSEKVSKIDAPLQLRANIKQLNESIVEKDTLDPDNTTYMLPATLQKNIQQIGNNSTSGLLPAEITDSIGKLTKGVNLLAAKDMGAVFYGFVFVMAGMLFFSNLLPREHVRSKKPNLRKIKELFANRNLVLFFVIAFFYGAASTASMQFLSIYLDSIGANGGLIGYSWAFAASFEIIILIYNKKIMDFIGVKWMIVIGMSASSLRWFLCSITHNPYYAIPIQMLQSLSFVALFVGAITFVFKESPPAFRVIGQFTYRSIGSGLGPIFGMLLGGYMFDTFGIFKMYKITSLIILSAALLTIFFIKEPVGKPRGKV